MRPPCGVVSISPDRAIKDSVVTAFDYMRANKSRLGMERDIDNYDFDVQIVDLMQHFFGNEYFEIKSRFAVDFPKRTKLLRNCRVLHLR